MATIESYLEQMNKMESIFRSPAFDAAHKAQTLLQKIAFPLSDYIDKAQAIATSALLQQPAIDIIARQQETYSKLFPFQQTISALEQYGFIENKFSHISAMQNQIQQYSEVFRPSNALLAAMESGNALTRAFNQSGVLDAISYVCRSITAIEAMDKLSVLIPKFDLFDNDVYISDDSIQIDGVNISRDEVFEVAQVFEATSIESLTIPQRLDKIKSKNWYFFLCILWCIFYSLCLSPVVEQTLDEVREIIGINRIIEKIDIKKWIDELFNNSLIEDENTDIPDLPIAEETPSE